MTPKEKAQVKLATMRLDGDPNADAYRHTIALCDVAEKLGIVKMEFTINTGRRINRLMCYEHLTSGPVTDVATFPPWPFLLEVLKVMKSTEIFGNARYRVTPADYSFARVAKMGLASTEAVMTGRAELAAEMQEHDPVDIL